MLTRQRLKELLIAELMLDLKATDIGDDTPLSAPPVSVSIPSMLSSSW